MDPQILLTRLKIKSGDYNSVPRPHTGSCLLFLRSQRRIDVSKAGNRSAGGRVAGLSRLGVGRSWIANEGTIEYVLEIGSNVQSDPFLDSEDPSDTHGFRRTPLLPVVVVVRGPGAILADRRVDPSFRIQHKGLVRVVAVAIEIHREKRLTRNTVGVSVLEA